MAYLGQIEVGAAQLARGLEIREAIDAQCHTSGILGGLADAQRDAGELDAGAATLVNAFALMEETDERYFEAELHRLQGELHLAQGDAAAAETSFNLALAVAREQAAKSWELRTAASLSRLWAGQGKREEARQLLAEIYSWFTEGFETPDLRAAKALLASL